MAVKLKLDQEKLEKAMFFADRIRHHASAFRDSHGNWHLPCDGQDLRAAAFGPTGISRIAEPFEASYIENSIAEGSFKLVLAVEPHEWDHLESNL